MRQRDSLSLFLFSIVMDYILRLLKHAEAKELIHDYELNSFSKKITHLLFADDILLVAEQDYGKINNLL